MWLPQKLGKEPLVEAVFELRFKAKAPVSSILPGLVFAKLGGDKTIEQLPMADLPPSVLATLDPNFRYAPSVRIHWQNFVIFTGNQSTGLACKLPYPGWSTGFKSVILELVDLIAGAALVDTVERFSLKYTNIIPAELGVVTSVADFTLRLGANDAANNLFQIRAEIPKDDLISVVQIAAQASVVLPNGSSRKGVAIDVDTIAPLNYAQFASFLKNASEKLERVHSEAKTIFFGCLLPDTIAKLEPVYD
jgi:uncharacterized protein (TIGR04255 family)